MIFTGRNFGENGPRDLHCKYYLDVYSKKNQKVMGTPTRVVSMRQNVKTLSNVTINNKSFKLQRTNLGMSFGTAKAKQQLWDEARNLVRADDILDELAYVQREVGLNTANLPTHSYLRDHEEFFEGVQNLLPFSQHQDHANHQFDWEKGCLRLHLFIYLSYLMAYYNEVKRFELYDGECLQNTLKNPPSLITKG
ncbi:hypothetical protein BCR42DRAFT_396321 [Absidia repens]|uniref:Uncharacterized protein n=1 Tax=Absidia repens TaxID=90262 RepID=A0A1X2I4H9_9FUNG|nr:hypothetical protein BCR42DRAFT_396321 [Absidia repens]